MNSSLASNPSFNFNALSDPSSSSTSPQRRPLSESPSKRTAGTARTNAARASISIQVPELGTDSNIISSSSTTSKRSAIDLDASSKRRRVESYNLSRVEQSFRDRMEEGNVLNSGEESSKQGFSSGNGSFAGINDADTFVTGEASVNHYDVAGINKDQLPPPSSDPMEDVEPQNSYLGMATGYFRDYLQQKLADMST